MRLLGAPKGTRTPQQRRSISDSSTPTYLHYAFDEWMRRNYKSIPFERYADDILVHCRSEKQAKWIRTIIERRLNQCGLELNPEKTKIVHCKDSSRKGN
jgi:RNA-directed DNA polymerase